MKRMGIILLLPMLAGCGIPPAVAIASYALDGGLLVATGKTSKDHALSVAMQQDCNMFRVVSGETVCQQYEPTNRAAWALQRMEPNEEFLTTVADGRVIRVASDHSETVGGPVIAATGSAGAAARTTTGGSAVDESR